MPMRSGKNGVTFDTKINPYNGNHCSTAPPRITDLKHPTNPGSFLASEKKYTNRTKTIKLNPELDDSEALREKQRPAVVKASFTII